MALARRSILTNLRFPAGEKEAARETEKRRKGKGNRGVRGRERGFNVPRNANIVSFHFAIRRRIILRRFQYFHRFITIADNLTPIPR